MYNPRLVPAVLADYAPGSGVAPLDVPLQQDALIHSKRTHEDQLFLSSLTQQTSGEGQKKRKLDLVKCERCRIDKQKVVCDLMVQCYICSYI